MKLQFFVLSCVLVCIYARYLDFDSVVTVWLNERVEGDELIFFAYRISPFFESKNESKFFTEISYEAPDNVKNITYIWTEVRGVRN